MPNPILQGVSRRGGGRSRQPEPAPALKQTTTDFVIAKICLRNGMRKANVELREAKKRIRLLEQENEMVHRAATYPPLSNLPLV